MNNIFDAIESIDLQNPEKFIKETLSKFDGENDKNLYVY